MSIEASSFVLGLSMGRGNGIRKLILLGDANHGRGAYPSTKTIADYAACDLRTVQRHVGWLLERGFLNEGDQRMVITSTPRHRPIVYDVAMSTDQIHHWATALSPSGGSGLGQQSLSAGRRPVAGGINRESRAKLSWASP